MGRPKLNKSKSEANKEYVKKYREKNAEKYKEEDRKRKKNKLEYMKYVEPKKYEERLKKDRMRKRVAREKKKQEEVEANKGQAAGIDDTESTAVFTTKQSLHRSVSKVEKLLPKSPRKKREVIKGLANKYQLRIQLSKKGRKPNITTEDQISLLAEFFERPDIAYINPGRKDNKYIGIINGKKMFLQKRYLLWTLRELFEILNSKQNDGLQLTFKQMYKYIKSQKQLVLQKDIPDTSCLCEVCENTCLMAKSLKRLKPGHPTDPHKITELYCCDSANTECITGQCEECRPSKVLNEWNENAENASSSESSNAESDDEEQPQDSQNVDYNFLLERCVRKHKGKHGRRDCIDSCWLQWELQK